MATNKDTMSSNLTGTFDFNEFTVTKIDEKNGGEFVYSLANMLKKFDGYNVSFTAKVDTDIPTIEELAVKEEE